MITAEAFNARVAAAARNQRLGGTFRSGGVAGIWHHWMVSAEHDHDLLWRIHTSPGAVNERVAAIGYLRENDPRGWKLPENHPSIPIMRALYGDNFRYVDRLLTETIEPPFLLATAPAAGAKSLEEGGDFRRITNRLPVPQIFRTKAAWDLDLYAASVFLTAAPRVFSRAENLFHFPAPTKLTRFHIALASDLPSATFGTTYGGNKELARLYLTRDHGDPGTDQLYVEQRCFWSMNTVNVEPAPFGGLDDPTAFLTGNIVIDSITDTVFQGLSDLLEGASTVQFWSAA